MANDLQRTEKWRKDRLGVATSSKFGDIMAGSHLAGWKNYKAELVLERLTGQSIDTYKSAAMQWGTDNEPVARLLYELATDNEVLDLGFVKHPTLAAGASPDGQIVGLKGGPEFKCPNTATHLDTLHLGKIPKNYYWQMVGQMWIMGWEFVDYTSCDPRLPENARLRVIRVNRNDEDIAKLETQVRVFLDDVEAEVEFIKNYKEGNGGETTNTGKAKSVPSTVNA